MLSRCYFAIFLRGHDVLLRFKIIIIYTYTCNKTTHDFKNTMPHYPSPSSSPLTKKQHATPPVLLVCPCQQDTALCSHCVRRGLHDVWVSRERAQAEWQAAVDAYQPANEVYEFAELEDTSMQLRKQLQELQERTSALALNVARNSVRLEERQAQLLQQQDTGPLLEKLELLESSFFCSLNTSIHSTKEHIQVMRYGWALQAFRFHRIQVTLPKESERLGRRARGIGTIQGLPLPHAGPELFGVLPPMELRSALRLVASVTLVVAQCLSIKLPHPILLQYGTNKVEGDIIDMVRLSEDRADTAVPVPETTHHQQQQHTPYNDRIMNGGSTLLSASTTSLASLFGQSKSMFQAVTAAAVAATTLSSQSTQRPSHQRHQQQQTSTDMPSSSSSSPSSLIQQRLQYAQCAVLQEEDNENTEAAHSNNTPTGRASTRYILNDAATEEFAIAMQLLQNNVIILCIRAGVPVDLLWPAEAVLLNLHVLEEYCVQRVSENSDDSDNTSVHPE